MKSGRIPHLLYLHLSKPHKPQKTAILQIINPGKRTII